MEITVVGAGISGLTSAFVLKKKGHNVKIIAKELSPFTTSDKAAAFWFPYHIRNDERGINWCRLSYNKYIMLSTEPLTGVSMQKLIKGILNSDNEDLTWKNFMPEGSYKVMDTGLAKNYVTQYEVEVPLIETQIFLPWLMTELKKMNVEIQYEEVKSFHQIKDADILINCTALGSKQLCNDEELIPIRGQVALIEPNNFPFIFLDNEIPLYIVPRKDAIIIGGTFEEGINFEVCEPETIDKILINAYKIFPELKKQKVIGNWAGLRPYRATVRVEREGNIIHNYGHGGSGFTLAWGCAEEVSRLVESN